MTDFEKVRDYYGSFDEWARLDSLEGKLEFVRSLDILRRFLRPESRVLDLGGGPGRYTVALAQEKHRLWLADLSPELLAVARERIEQYRVTGQVESIDEVNAIDLGIYSDGMFDAVLAFGPYYHLVEEHARIQATREITRVVRDDGLVFVAFIPWLTGVSNLIVRASGDPGQVSASVFKEVFASGRFRNAAARGFQEGYCARPDELKDLFGSVGVSCLEIVSLRGIAAGKERALWKLEETDPDVFAEIMGALEETATNPAVVSLGGHALYIGRS